LRGLWERPAVWLGLFAFYFSAHALIRIAQGWPVNIDEAEALLWAQRLDWGYGPQPPLYIWAQAAVFGLTGPGVTGLAVLKALTLLGIYAAVFSLLRGWLGVSAAGLATLTLLWIPELGWESQRIRTHNVLATLIAAQLSVYMVKCGRGPRIGAPEGLILGLLIGAGLLAKWNFLFVPAALLGALWVWPEARPHVLRPALALAPAIAAAMVLPTLLWMLDNADVAFASAPKLGIGAEGGRAAQAASFSFSAARALIGISALPVLVLALFALFARRTALQHGMMPPLGEVRFLLVAAGGAVSLFLVAGLAVGATQVTTRWLMPFLVLAAPATAALLVPRLGARARLAWCLFSVALALSYLAGISLKTRRIDPHLAAEIQEAVLAIPEGVGGAITADVVVAANAGLLRHDMSFADVPLALAAPCGAGATVMLLVPPGGMPRIAGTLARHLEECGLAPAAPEVFRLSDGSELHLKPYGE
jgi:4-amino-4-deoxy-L-arabinose transferase-like glycosyltransferase